MKEKVIERECLVCGKRLKIRLKDNGEYRGGHYFGILKIPTGDGEHKKIKRTKIGDMEVDVVEWTGEHQKIEYWECDDCYQEE